MSNGVLLIVWWIHGLSSSLRGWSYMLLAYVIYLLMLRTYWSHDTINWFFIRFSLNYAFVIFFSIQRVSQLFMIESHFSDVCIRILFFAQQMNEFSLNVVLFALFFFSNVFIHIYIFNVHSHFDDIIEKNSSDSNHILDVKISSSVDM